MLTKGNLAPRAFKVFKYPSMTNYEPKIGVIGLGYVGLPVAVHMSAKFPVVGFDVNSARVEQLNSGIDFTREVSKAELEASTAKYSSNPESLDSVDFFIVAVPTPIDDSKSPDLGPLKASSRTVGQHLKKGDIVVYESTVYPGATEEDCIPILEKESGLKAGVDFKVGYSPERINPGDKERTFTKITKVVSAQDEESLEKVSYVYGAVVTAGIFKAKSIKVAEAAKVIENTQRDLNIALMNELSILFDRMDIPTLDVLEAAGTKWNFLKFVPGLVGGHCIGVDPYYLTYKAHKLDYQPDVILSGRKINDGMSKFVIEKLLKSLVSKGANFEGAYMNVYGLTFKENCPDVRNSKVFNIIKELETYGIKVRVCDPHADLSSVKTKLEHFDPANPPKALASIVTVAHDDFKDFSDESFSSDVIFDLKGLYKNKSFTKELLSL